MIRMLIFIIIATIVLLTAYFFFKQVSLAKRIITAGGLLFSSAVGILMQGSFAWHMSLLAILGLSLVTALLFMKIEEREKKEKVKLKEERLERKKQSAAIPQEAKELKEEPVNKQESTNEKSEKVFGMESIGPVGKGN
ncbi:hypothetical protein R0K05_11540 [Planococcus sp. SIMBA_160]